MKRTLALIAAMALCGAYVPVAGISAKAEESGQCGDDVYWTLDDGGTLTIYGTGDMYEWEEESPWCNNQEIINVVIEEGVTYLGSYAFQGCTKLENVSIPDSMIGVGDWAFFGTRWRASEAPREGLWIVNGILLDYQGSMSEVVIPDGVKSIAGGAFTLASMESVTIPDSVTFIGTRAFSSCNALTEVTIPGSVEIIDDSAFRFCQNLASVVIEEGTTDIRAEAFLLDEKLTSISIPKSVEHIGADAFEYTGWMQERKAENPLVVMNDILINASRASGDVVIPDGVRKIGEAAFEDNRLVRSITLPDSVYFIDRWGINMCSNLISVKLSENLEEIGAFGIAQCPKLDGVVLPESLEVIGEGAFYADESLTEITIPENVWLIDAWAFEECASLDAITILNPECDIYDSDSTICNYYDEEEIPWYDGTIYGYENSTAQAYAENWLCDFVALEDDGGEDYPYEEEVLKGDANNDGSVNILDVITINRVVLGKEVLPEAQLKAIDFNGNGQADAEESLTILKFLVGIVTEL